MRKWLQAIVVPVAALALLGPTAAIAEEGPPAKHQVIWANTLVARVNPLGLLDLATLEYRLRLYPSENPALQNNYLGLAAKPMISPAFFRMGAALDLMPLSVLRLGVAYDFIHYFGTFGHMQSFPSADAAHDDDTIEKLGDDGENFAGKGVQLTLSGLLQAKIGPIAARSNFKAMRLDYVIEPGDTVFYEPLMDMMCQDEGWLVTNDADLLFISEFGLVAGVRYAIIKAFYEKGDDPNGPTHRFGPLVKYEFYSNPGSGLSSVAAFVLANWWLKHRYRTGQKVSQGLPYLAIGLAIGGDVI